MAFLAFDHDKVDYFAAVDDNWAHPDMIDSGTGNFVGGFAIHMNFVDFETGSSVVGVVLYPSKSGDDHP